MIKNILKTAIRHIFKYFGYSFLNIIGLTLGITSSLFLIIYVADELSYDNYHEKADRIYRVSSTITEPDDQFTWIVAQIPFGPQVEQDYPEVESFVRFINMPRQLYKYEDNEYNEDNFFYADSTLFSIFNYNVIEGDAIAAVSEPNKIALTKKVALKYFGNTNAIGKTLTAGANSYEVVAILENVPSNSHFRFDAIAARNNLPKQLGSWGNFGVFTYLLLPDNIDVKAFETKLDEMYDNYMKSIFGAMNITIKYSLESLKDIHLYSTNASEPEPTGSITYVYIFGIVAFFLVLIAAMNYMNLATARSAKRAKEVGLRKVAGTSRGPLLFQFLAESVFLTLVSLLFSIVLVIILLHQFNIVAGKSFDLSILISPIFLAALFSIVLIIGILGGCYPAFYLSRFNPSAVLKGEVTQGASGSSFRKVLVVIQFSISVIMIICTLVVYNQLNFLKTMDQGFDQENVISLRLDGEMINKYPVLKTSLLNHPGIKYVSSTNTPIGEGSGKLVFNVETNQGMMEKGVNFSVVDHDFIDALGIKISEGRNFRQDMRSDTLQAVIVNETFVKRMAWSKALGKKIQLGQNAGALNARVVGVMADYHQTGMYNETESLLLAYRINNNIVYIKINEDETDKTLSHIETQWNEVFPDKPFEYTFLEERFNNQFEADEKRGVIFTLFTILAIIIACLGLFGLVSYMVEQRTKEIGVRKTFGANEISILELIIKYFLKLALIAIIIALPIAYYFMSRWLENYVYRTKISIYLLIIAALSTVLISIITISFKAYQAANLNPAESVKMRS
ncbi:ABC transporter permease [uncultured Draconibacterium sp.]|uniref:ABC transporter permease n=1 Tax=uncultured Draconibacterium sp. TaxID=1573823 RepID=UPI0029C740E5|nr:ABC transporter permease [uncultured Draconibacterium sp.]